jgi:hypothetical protein
MSGAMRNENEPGTGKERVWAGLVDCGTSNRRVVDPVRIFA